jgi:hypothetical protein
MNEEALDFLKSSDREGVIVSPAPSLILRMADAILLALKETTNGG